MDIRGFQSAQPRFTAAAPLNLTAPALKNAVLLPRSTFVTGGSLKQEDVAAGARIREHLMIR